jgi:hypothetical protein
VDLIEVTQHDDHIDLDVQFTCSMRYVTHLPQSEGDEVRVELRPMPDCGQAAGAQIAGELPTVSGGEGIISAARVESDIPGQLSLSIQWTHSQTFVLAQGADLHDLRIRLLVQAPPGRVSAGTPTDVVSAFVINLESQLRPFTPEQIQAARDQLKLPVFVSGITVDGQRWYRLRGGPILHQADAQQMLSHALAFYPRAWLAIDETVMTQGAGSGAASPAAQSGRIGLDPPLPEAQREQLFDQALQSSGRHDYDQAIRLLTKLLRQGEYPQRAASQELLGIAYERSGALAQAKAEYEEYLYRYPNGAAASRVRQRLHVLETAQQLPQSEGQARASPSTWRVNGGAGQLLRYDGTNVNSTVAPSAASATTATNSSANSRTDALYSDVDVLARRMGERYGIVARFSGGYDRNFGAGAPSGLTEVSVAALDVTQADHGLLLRVGRQVRNDGGVLGTFDGGFLGWQFSRAWNVNATFGYPVQQINEGVQTSQPFAALSLAYAPPGVPWDADAYVTQQQFDGFHDRQAVGFDAHYLAPRGSVAALVDYDVYYHSLNAATLLGTLQLPAHWTFSFDAEQRNAPVLTTRNALIGQPYTTLMQLEQIFTPAQILMLARERTPASSNYSLTATRPMGERLQLAITSTASEIGSTPAGGGVATEPGTGLETTYELQVYASGLWAAGDFDVISLAHADTQIGRIDDVGITSRFPLGGAWRLGPRLTAERRLISSDSSRELDFLPSFLLDYQRSRWLLQMEAGAEIGSRDATLQTQATHRIYVSLAYRVAF